MFTEEELRRLFGDDFDVEQTPETMAYAASLDYATDVAREMKRQGLSLKELAGKMGVKPPTLSEKLNGKSNLTFKSAAQIAKALGCDLEAPKLCNKPVLQASASLEYEDIVPSAMYSFTHECAARVTADRGCSKRTEGGRGARTRLSSAA